MRRIGYTFTVLLLLLVMTVFGTTIIHASSLEITAKQTTVANIRYYVHTKDGKDVPDGTEFTLIGGGSGDIVLKTKDSLLEYTNLPFGEYIIKPKTSGIYNELKLKLDLKYVDTQHELKDYIISFTPETDNGTSIEGGGSTDGGATSGGTSSIDKGNVKTNDVSTVNLYLVMMFISMCVLMVSIRKVRLNR